MLFAGLANGMAFLVLGRMRRVGRQVGIWRRLGKDWALYREYWQIAAAQNWSRAPLVIAAASFVVAGCFLYLSVIGVRLSR